ncbi:putative rhamnogalacturonate lyase B [Dorcoceras hygrometricum]|uniref:Putative rhamnogalacturonate lyase B n=1 Tax=Dorcoceras hygrometricum TaxID=472368 RepID=A0A2Z7D525_9LAMI|nr:putative rhamnogalacturonate lyase B [Dorcoceras hygrometricum]
MLSDQQQRYRISTATLDQLSATILAHLDRIHPTRLDFKLDCDQHSTMLSDQQQRYRISTATLDQLSATILAHLDRIHPTRLDFKLDCDQHRSIQSAWLDPDQHSPLTI